MTSRLFTSENRKKIENKVLNILNNIQLMNKNTINSTRAVGDAVQSFLEENIIQCLPNNLVTKVDTSFARRSMADLAFEDIDGNYYIIDIKTHNLNTDFNMPNLTSVKRLAEFYSDNNNYFIVLIVSYVIENEKLHFKQCWFAPIEYFDWSCLRLGALGVGQIQIANSNIINIDQTNMRKDWMMQFCDTLDSFYPNEIKKIEKRINYFKKIKKYWENQPD